MSEPITAEELKNIVDKINDANDLMLLRNAQLIKENAKLREEIEELNDHLANNG